MSTLSSQLEDLHLLHCALLPGEILSFERLHSSTDENDWDSLVKQYAEDPDSVTGTSLPPARFQVKIEHAHVWFEVQLSAPYRIDNAVKAEEAGRLSGLPSISVKGEHLGRAEQERWQRIVNDALEEVQSSEYPVYELLATHLLPRLHAERGARPPPPSGPAPTDAGGGDAEPHYHALLSSHHLVAPGKRRALAQWAGERALRGFAKVGHPGVVYCAGARGAVADFVRRVRALQWRALRVRFVEPVPTAEAGADSPGGGGREEARWVEFEKVGEVVREMRRLGRERYVVEMGIGSAG